MSDLAMKLMSYADYVALEAQGEGRHEFVDGEIFAMTGGTRAHAALQAAVIVQLSVGLRGRTCRVYGPDARVRIASLDRAVYPDGTVVCGPVVEDPEDPHAIVNPSAVIEVLSPSTEAWDRGDKATGYRQIPSLHTILLVSPAPTRVEVFERSAQGWVLREATAGSLHLEHLDLAMDVDELARVSASA
jgi:Uma2 family endonuclease